MTILSLEIYSFQRAIRILYMGSLRIKIYSSGYEAYPDDYRVVIGNLQDYIELLCKKYSADTYIEEEADDRRRL